MNKFLMISVPVLTFTACASKPETIVEYRAVNIYPQLDDVEAPKDFQLKTFDLELPRDFNAQPYVRDLPECKNYSYPEDAFDPLCLAFPPLENTNIYIGLTKENFENLQYNLIMLTKRENAWRARLDAINEQREEWRQKNLENIAAARKLIEDVEETGNE